MFAPRATSPVPPITRARRARRRVLTLCAGAQIALSAIGAASATEVRVVRIDGTSTTGDGLITPDGRTFELSAPEGAVSMRWDDLSLVEFRPAVPGASAKRRIPRPPVAFHLADGGRLFGELMEPSDGVGGIVAATALGNPTHLPFDRLAAVELGNAMDHPQARGLFERSLASRKPGADMLITRERRSSPTEPGNSEAPALDQAEPARAVEGRLISLGPEAGAFVFAERERSFPTDRAYGIVLAAGLWDGEGPAARREFPVRVELSDGSSFTGRIERADRESLRMATSLRLDVTVDVDDIEALTFTSDRVVHLGDLTPTAQATLGIMHRPWAPRIDRSVSGGPISLGNRTFERGLGVHSRTELTYDLGAAYETFAATIGIDDAVRPRGSVVFRVIGDERILYESGVVTGKDAPIDIRVDVTGVRTLELIVEFGGELDLADHAAWAAARLLKPAAPSEPGRIES